MDLLGQGSYINFIKNSHSLICWQWGKRKPFTLGILINKKKIQVEAAHKLLKFWISLKAEYWIFSTHTLYVEQKVTEWPQKTAKATSSLHTHAQAQRGLGLGVKKSLFFFLFLKVGEGRARVYKIKFAPLESWIFALSNDP